MFSLGSTFRTCVMSADVKGNVYAEYLENSKGFNFQAGLCLLPLLTGQGTKHIEQNSVLEPRHLYNFYALCH